LARGGVRLAEQTGSSDAVLAQRRGAVRGPSREANGPACVEQTASDAESDGARSEYRDQCLLLRLSGSGAGV
jgi:hypothetical protein